MLYIQQWKFKPGYHQKVQKILGPQELHTQEQKCWGDITLQDHLKDSVKAEDPKALYEHAAEWAEFLDWETTPVFTDDEAGPICSKNLQLNKTKLIKP